MSHSYIALHRMRYWQSMGEKFFLNLELNLINRSSTNIHRLFFLNCWYILLIISCYCCLARKEIYFLSLRHSMWRLKWFNSISSRIPDIFQHVYAKLQVNLDVVRKEAWSPFVTFLPYVHGSCCKFYQLTPIFDELCWSQWQTKTYRLNK